LESRASAQQHIARPRVKEIRSAFLKAGPLGTGVLGRVRALAGEAVSRWEIWGIDEGDRGGREGENTFAILDDVYTDKDYQHKKENACYCCPTNATPGHGVVRVVVDDPTW
jgi:hypothetical protein